MAAINQKTDFLIAISIIIITILFSVVVYHRILRVNFFIADLRFSHWLSIIGTIGIAVATPLFSILKRSSPTSRLRNIRAHIFLNLTFYTLIVFHLATQLARPADNYPDLGSGIAMFIAMSVQILLGFTLRFRPQTLNPATNKFIHASIIMVFYFVIIFHVLHGFNII